MTNIYVKNPLTSRNVKIGGKSLAITENLALCTERNKTLLTLHVNSAKTSLSVDYYKLELYQPKTGPPYYIDKSLIMNLPDKCNRDVFESVILSYINNKSKDNMGLIVCMYRLTLANMWVVNSNNKYRKVVLDKLNEYEKITLSNAERTSKVRIMASTFKHFMVGEGKNTI
jgi:hypothetical protein